MKKKEKPRRLTLSRETIQILNGPALLEGARGGIEGTTRWRDCIITTVEIVNGPAEISVTL